MITGGREVPDPAQSTWACQEVQEPENVGSGLTAGVETVAAVVTLSQSEPVVTSSTRNRL